MKTRRFWAIVTAVAMMISLLPAVSFAAEDIQVDVSALTDVSVIDGDEPMLPKTLSATKADGSKEQVSVTWKGADPVGGKAVYTGTIEGYDKTVEVNVEVLPCDHAVETFYNAGSSSEAKFGWNNKLGYMYNGGTVIFDTTITVPTGSNKLISYGNETTGSFDGAGPIIRFANEQKVFDYYDGTAKAWKQSTVACTVGSTYRIRIEANIDEKTYKISVTDEDGVKRDVTPGFVTFRNPGLSTISLMYYNGDGYTEGEDTNHAGGITSHRTYWQGGADVTVNYKSAAGETLADSVKTKVADGAAYTNTKQYIVKDDKVYVLQDTAKLPSIVATKEGNNVIDFIYDEVDVNKCTVADVDITAGKTPVMPGKAAVQFENDQWIEFNATWDTANVKSETEGDYTAKCHIAELNLDVDCTVHVKTVEPDDESQLHKVSVATNNGGWNWYVEPSGTHISPSSTGDKFANRYEGNTFDINGDPIIYKSNDGYKFEHDRTYMGWVEDTGDIVVAQVDHDNKDEYTRVVIHEKLESDDHNNPAVVVLPDGRIMAIYSMHTNEPYMYFRVTKRPEDITEWCDEQFYHGENANATYPSVFMVHDDPDFPDQDVIYIGWRGVHWMPTLAKFPIPDKEGKFPIKSNGDGIQPLMEQTQFTNTTYGYPTWSDGNNDPAAYINGGDNGRRPYAKYDYDFERNRIYVTFTANHPDNDKRNNIYYLYLNIDDQNLYTAKDRLLQPLPKENSADYIDKGANDTSGQWGVVTTKLVEAYPELIVFNATEQTGGQDFWNPRYGNVERRGWTWDIIHNDKGEPCIVYVDITATPPDENGLPPQAGENYPDVTGDNSRRFHYYYYARWDSETQQWVNTFLTYAGKWFHQNATQERCYSGGLTFDHNFSGDVIYLSIPTEGKYGNVHEIYRWESDDYGATWTTRQQITKDSPTPNARPNAIYNYKMDENGENQGPRLLWISGEYRYWMNYEYKTGVKTDYPNLVTQDDPEMFADAILTVGGEEIDKLPVGDEEITAQFTISNISIGKGEVKLALAHYDKDGILKGVVRDECDVPARSVPQTSIVGADVDTNPDHNRPNGLSAMGEPEVVEELSYTPEGGFEEGDSVKLFAWSTGIEQPMAPLFGIPFEMSTSGSRYIVSEDFGYTGDDKLVLTDPDSFNGWDAKIYSTTGSRAITDSDKAYAAITKAPFGNTALHLYHVNNASGEGVMVSHEIPDTEGKDYTLEFTMRHIDEMSWRNTDNQGFTLSHGVPTKRGDETDSQSAFQYRFKSNSNDENGRGTYGMLRHTTAFDGGSEVEVFHNVPLGRDVSDTDRYTRVDYSKGEGYYDNEKGVYIHDYNDALYTGDLLRVKVNVHPKNHVIDMSVSDGYRTAYCSYPYEGEDTVDWDKNPIDTITFSVGSERWGEIYIDDFRMYLSDDTSALRSVTITPSPAKGRGNDWTILPLSDGSNVIFSNDNGEVLEVGGQKLVPGSDVDTWPYDGGDNHKFYIEEANGGYLLRGKQSGLYVKVFSDGSTKLANKADATVFTIEDSDVPVPEAVVELAGMIADGSYEAIMDAVFPEE